MKKRLIPFVLLLSGLLFSCAERTVPTDDIIEFNDIPTYTPIENEEETYDVPSWELDEDEDIEEYPPEDITWEEVPNQEEEKLPSEVTYAVSDLPKGKELSSLNFLVDKSYYASLAIGLAEKDIENLGFTTFSAFALILDEEDEEITNTIPGIGFTDGSIYEATSEGIIYSCGFLQVIDDETEIILDEEIVSKGIFVLKEGDDRPAYVIESNAFLDGQAGIYDSYYFAYKQMSAFGITIDVKKATNNLEDFADEDLDIYDYDKGEYVYEGSLFRKDPSTLEAYSLYGPKVSNAYKNAIDLMNLIIQKQDENGYKVGLSSVVLISLDYIDALSLNEQKEAINGYLSTYLQSVSLEENQYLVLGGDGLIQVATDPNYGIAKGRMMSGMLKTITSLAMLAGGVFAVTITAGAATPVLTGIALMVASSSSIYAWSGLTEGVQDIYYAAKGDTTTPSVNFLKDKIIQAAGGDTEKGEAIYETIGTVLGLALTFFQPISTAMSSWYQAGSGISGVFQSAIHVARAVVVHTAKIAITAAISNSIGEIAQKLATKLGMSEYGSYLVSIGAKVIGGMFVYNALNNIDSMFNISGFQRVEPLGLEFDEEKPVYKRIKTQGDMDLGDPYSSYKTKNLSSKNSYLNDLVERGSYEMEIKAPKIRIYVDEGMSIEPFMRVLRDAAPADNHVSGFCDMNESVIYISAQQLQNDGLAVIYSVAHLMRHLYQLKNADFNSPILKALREDNYIGPDDLEAYFNNPAEIDADNYGAYWLERAKHAYEEYLKDPTITYVENTLTFSDPNTFREVK